MTFYDETEGIRPAKMLFSQLRIIPFTSFSIILDVQSISNRKKYHQFLLKCFIMVKRSVQKKSRNVRKKKSKVLKSSS